MNSVLSKKQFSISPGEHYVSDVIKFHGDDHDDNDDCDVNDDNDDDDFNVDRDGHKIL